jgi:hypothetical protein
MERERRKYPRANVRVNAVISVDNKPISVVTRNISRSGMLLETTDSIDEFTVIAVTLELPFSEETVRINCEGVIVRIQPGQEPGFPYSLAVHFVEIDEPSGDIISKFVDMALTGNELQN